MSETSRSIAVDILNRVEQTGAYAEPLLNAALLSGALTDVRDRGLLTQIVYGTLRMQGNLDWIIRQLYHGRSADLETITRNILRTALYQLRFTDRIPAFAVVDAAVALAKDCCPQRSGLVNALLRNALRKQDKIPWPDPVQDPAGHLSIVQSHPLWMVRRWLGLFGPEETAALLKANNEIPALALRINRQQITRAAARERLAAEGFSCDEAPYSQDGLIVTGSSASLTETSLYREGLIHIQDEASQLIAHLVAPLPGETILDLCAGSGGKTSHLAALMENAGQVVAVDIHPRKLRDLEALSHRLGAARITTQSGDAEQDLGEEFRAHFDRVLVDAPCSGLGTLRRNPEIKWRLQARDIGPLVNRQRRILEAAAPCPHGGGLLIYATCTLMPEENEAVILDFLHHHREYVLEPPAPPFPSSLLDARGFFRTLPHRDGMDGFFGARLRRRR